MMPVKPLTKTEQKWLDDLESVMMRCPSKRLESFTIGDNDLTFYDKNVLEKWQDERGGQQGDVPQDVSRSGAYLANVGGKFGIVSAAG